MSNYISEILLALSDAEVRFIVGGGVAAVLHGVERSTLDVDVALDMAPPNVEKFLEVMQQLRLQPRVPVSARDLMNPKAIQRMVAEKGAVVFSFVDVDRPLRHVDLFLRNDLSFAELGSSAQMVPIEGRAIRIIGLEKLLAIKRTISPLRDKDLIDIKELEKLKSSREKPS